MLLVQSSLLFSNNISAAVIECNDEYGSDERLENGIYIY